jgi:hypothetical protein
MLIIFCFDLYGFNWEDCKAKVMKGTDVTGGAGLLSMTQYSSSWGPCSAIASDVARNRYLFFAVNQDQIRTDIAIGDGEFLSTYIHLRCIYDFQKGIAATHLRKNYSQIFNKSRNIEDTFWAIEERLSAFGDCENSKS